MKKVCLLNDSPETIGIGRYAYRLSQALNDLKTPSTMARFVYPGDSVDKTIRQQVIEAPCRFANKTSPKVQIALNRVFNWRFCLAGVVPKGFELYHATNQHLVGPLLAAKGLKVLTILDLFELDADYNPIMRFFVGGNLRELERVDRIVTLSNYSKKEITDRLDVPKDKIDVTFAGVDSAIFNPGSKSAARKTLGLPSTAKIVLHLGGDIARKNLKGAILAFHRLKLPNAIFVHVGPFSNATKKLINQLELQPRVRQFNHQPDSALANFYRAADAFIFPSFKEGFGLPVLEAMACGTPVICSNATSLPEVVGSAAITAHPHDVDALTEGLREVLEDDKIARRLVNAGLRRAKLFTWRQCARATLKAYSKAGLTGPR